MKSDRNGESWGGGGGEGGLYLKEHMHTNPEILKRVTNQMFVKCY